MVIIWIRVQVWVVKRIDWVGWPVMTSGRRGLPRRVAAAWGEGIASVPLRMGAGVSRRQQGATAVQWEVKVFDLNVMKIKVAFRLVV